MERGAAPQLKSVEFVFYTKRVGEIFDVHTDFTAGQMLYLIRSMTLYDRFISPRRPLRVRRPCPSVLELLVVVFNVVLLLLFDSRDIPVDLLPSTFGSCHLDPAEGSAAQEGVM